MTLSTVAQFLSGLLIPVSFEMFIKKVKNGLFWGCAAILAFVLGKELLFDTLVERQSLFHDSGDLIYYALGIACAIIVVLSHRKIKGKK